MSKENGSVQGWLPRASIGSVGSGSEAMIAPLAASIESRKTGRAASCAGASRSRVSTAPPPARAPMRRRRRTGQLGHAVDKDVPIGPPRRSPAYASRGLPSKRVEGEGDGIFVREGGGDAAINEVGAGDGVGDGGQRLFQGASDMPAKEALARSHGAIVSSAMTTGVPLSAGGVSTMLTLYTERALVA